jgi:hypothetical protein
MAEIGGNHEPLDLRRALDDLHDLRVAEPLFHRVVSMIPALPRTCTASVVARIGGVRGEDAPPQNSRATT